MSENQPARKVVTIVNNKWWDEQQEHIAESLRLCDICIQLLRQTHDGDCNDIAMSQDLVERRLVELRQQLERVHTPL